MNKFKVGDRVRTYETEVRASQFVNLIRDGIVTSTIFTDGRICVRYDNNQDNVVHYKQCRRLVKKKRECPHPHITREKLAEAWDSYPTKYTPSLNSLLFRHICEELGL